MNTYSKKSREFKFEVMRLHFEDAVSVNELAKRFDLPRQTVYGWRSQYRRYGANSFVGCGHGRATEAELFKLRSENERLRRENRSLRNEIKSRCGNAV
ncbi:MAG: transposase [Oscillospiraceae bacterium]|jgi:transposase|nr:transposase [Oscillospiraceae bacterium]